MKKITITLSILMLSILVNAQTWDLTFYPDTGFRWTNAAIPRVFYDSIAGIYYLYYNDTQVGGGNKYVTSSDGLSFSNPQQQPPETSLNDSSFIHDPKIIDLYNGIYKKYSFSNDTLYSAGSTDRINFTVNTGFRYILNTSDNGTSGVYDFITFDNDTVVLIYVGDLYGANNCRTALSVDNGQTFTFQSNNALGDIAAGGGPNTYVDPKITYLDTGKRLFVMKGGNTIHSFFTNDGLNYTYEGIRIQSSDFSTFNSTTLNDPHVIKLPDGRYRMYVASYIENGGSYTWCIISATTGFPTETVNIPAKNTSIFVYPNPAHNQITINNKQSIINNIEILDITGKVVFTVIANEIKQSVNIESLQNGLYFLKFQLSDRTEVVKFIKE